MRKVTYLLGAGASHNKLPILREFSDELGGFANVLKHVIARSQVFLVNNNNILNTEEDILEGQNIPVANNLYTQIHSVIQELWKHQTVDTLAKKHYLNNNISQLQILKNVLSIFFLFKQLINVNPNPGIVSLIPGYIPDNRYDSFIAALVGTQKGKFDLPGNVNIITWNYDVQFELAFREYKNDTIAKIQKENQILPSTAWYKEDTSSYSSGKFSLIRLNGIIGIKSLKSMEDKLQDTYIDDLIARPTINELCNIFTDLDKTDELSWEKSISFFNYNWEYQYENVGNVYQGYNQIHQYARKIMENTDILIVIGYSFPIFNRKFDADLIKRLVNNCKHIYIQDQYPKIIAERIRSIIPPIAGGPLTGDPVRPGTNIIGITPLEDLNQFYLPNELTT